MTLDQLRDRYEDARKTFLDEFWQAVVEPDLFGNVSIELARIWKEHFDLTTEEWSTVEPNVNSVMFALTQSVKDQASIYLVARDCGPKAAAMFKLSDGAVDPRASK